MEYTEHAKRAMVTRRIAREWVEAAVEAPVLRTRDAVDPEIERFYRRVPEFGNRVLRVAVNTSGEPWRVVSTFFDRGKRTLP